MDVVHRYIPADALPSWLAKPIYSLLEPKYAYAPPKTGLLVLVDLTQPSLWVAVGMVLFNPIYWNIVARNEFHNKSLTKLFGSPYLGCYFLAVTIFGLGIFRDFMFERALASQPHLSALSHPLIQTLAYALIITGQLFVWTSIYALGITGTYLGDYFGILMSARVTGFPFNVLNDPMYVGSTMAFVGGALVYRSPAGLAVGVLVWVVYVVALRFEGPFTDKIYSGQHKKTDTPSTSSAKSTSAAPAPASAALAAPAPGSIPTKSVPATPRKSARLSTRSGTDTEDQSDSNSYAGAARKTPGRNANALASEDEQSQPIPAVTPRARRIKKEAGVVGGAASPARMTRSRSKGRVGSETE